MIACWTDDEDNRLQIRDHLSRKYAFGVPGNYALDCLARYGPLVEIGAGTGYWARCLRERGVNIVAYDVVGDAWHSWFRPSIVTEIRQRGTRAIVARPHPQRAEPVLWTEVLQGGPEVLARHSERTLLLCWPDPLAIPSCATHGFNTHLLLSGHSIHELIELAARVER